MTFEQQKMAGPGDSGPCPHCGKEMKEQIYIEEIVGIGTKELSGRYWHMKNEHGIFEHYRLNRL